MYISFGLFEERFRENKGFHVIQFVHNIDYVVVFHIWVSLWIDISKH